MNLGSLAVRMLTPSNERAAADMVERHDRGRHDGVIDIASEGSSTTWPDDDAAVLGAIDHAYGDGDGRVTEGEIRRSLAGADTSDDGHVNPLTETTRSPAETGYLTLASRDTDGDGSVSISGEVREPARPFYLAVDAAENGDGQVTLPELERHFAQDAGRDGRLAIDEVLRSWGRV